MVVKIKSNTKKLKLIKGGNITNEQIQRFLIKLFEEEGLIYDSINQPFIDLEQPKQAQAYVRSLEQILYETARMDDKQHFIIPLLKAFRENIMNTIKKNKEALDGAHSVKNFIAFFFKDFRNYLQNQKNYYNLIIVDKYHTRTIFYNLFHDLISAYDDNKINQHNFIEYTLLRDTLDTLGEVLNVKDITDANGKIKTPALHQIEDMTIMQIPQTVIFLDYLVSLNNEKILESIKNYIDSYNLHEYYVEGGVNWETNNTTDAKKILLQHLIFELNRDPNNVNSKKLLEIISGSASKDKKKEKEKKPVKEKEKPKEVQRQEPRIHQQQLPQEVARPLVQSRQSQPTIREVGNARQIAPISMSQPPVPPSAPSQPPVLRGRPPALSTLTTAQATSRAQRRIAQVMGHLQPTIISAEVNKQKEELETSLNELINKDPVNAGFLINDAIEFIKEPVPHNVNISQWVNEFDKTADEWAMEFSAIRTSPQRKSRLVTTFKNNFKELIKIMPNINELFVMLVNDMARSAQVARTNIPQVETDSQFTILQENLLRYQRELTQPASRVNQSVAQPQRRPQLRTATSQQSTGRVPFERPLMGGNKKTTKSKNNTKKILNK